MSPLWRHDTSRSPCENGRHALKQLEKHAQAMAKITDSIPIFIPMQREQRKLIGDATSIATIMVSRRSLSPGKHSFDFFKCLALCLWDDATHEGETRQGHC